MPRIENPSGAFQVFADHLKSFELQDYATSAQEDFLTVCQQLDRLRATARHVFGDDSEYVRALGAIQFRYPRAKQRNAVSYFNRDKVHTLTILRKILDELRISYPNRALSENTAPAVSAVPNLEQSLAAFRRDHPVGLKTAFIIMSLVNTPFHQQISKAVQDTLALLGVVGVRASDKVYHPDLYSNILTYVRGCGFGIAVLDRVSAAPTNLNVAFQVGYMLALNKQVCLLRDKTLLNAQPDLMEKLSITIDSQAVASIHAALSHWIAAHPIER
jgi:hypothetical protein